MKGRTEDNINMHGKKSAYLQRNLEREGQADSTKQFKAFNHHIIPGTGGSIGGENAWKCSLMY